MADLVDKRFGSRGRVFVLYLLGPIFLGSLLIYMLSLSITSAQSGAGNDLYLFIVATVIVAVFFVADVVAVWEARKTIQRAEWHGEVIRFIPLCGKSFESRPDNILDAVEFRSFGYIPGVSVIDNNRSNIKLIFRDRPPVFLFGSCDADRWIKDLGIRPVDEQQSRGQST